MSFRNNLGSTGSNNIPLGNRRRFGGDDAKQESHSPPRQSSYTPSGPSGSDAYKRGRSPKREPVGDDGERRRKKRNRWGDATDNKAAGLMGLPTAILSNMTSEQLEAYTLHLRIEEITQKLKIDDVVPADGDRSPSPPPQYDNFGKRVNTREYRYRKRLEDERHKLIEKAMKIIPNYHPPQDYRRPTKTSEKVYVPVNDYPEINFIGLLIGPRGNTLKTMEKDSGAKIAIRGKGSVKEGKGRSDAAHTSNLEEDLHCLIMADTEEKVNKAKKLIHNVIETAASIPEGQNEHKRNQLRDLAALNGTLRDDENQACQNCGQIGHRRYECPEQRNFTANIVCRVCGNSGHMARDCPDRQRGSDWREGPAAARPNPGQQQIGGGDAIDHEYEQLMQELSGGAPSGVAPARIEAGPGHSSAGPSDNAKPWEQRPTGGPAPWQQRDRGNDFNNDRGGYSGGFNSRDPPPGPSGGPAPWARDRASRGDDRRNDNYGGGRDNGYNGYMGGGGGGGYSGGGYSGSGAAPWQQSAPPPPPPPSNGAYGAYGQAPGYSAPHAAAPWQQAALPPPPPTGNAPPPPPSDHAPPPPPPGN